MKVERNKMVCAFFTVCNYHYFHWYATLENKTPAETFPKFPSVSLTCYWHIGSKSINHSPLAWLREGQKVTLVAVIGGFQSNLSITRKTDGNFGNVSASVLFFQCHVSTETVVTVIYFVMDLRKGKNCRNKIITWNPGGLQTGDHTSVPLFLGIFQPGEPKKHFWFIPEPEIFGIFDQMKNAPEFNSRNRVSYNYQLTKFLFLFLFFSQVFLLRKYCNTVLLQIYRSGAWSGLL